MKQHIYIQQPALSVQIYRSSRRGTDMNRLYNISPDSVCNYCRRWGNYCRSYITKHQWTHLSSLDSILVVNKLDAIHIIVIHQQLSSMMMMAYSRPQRWGCPVSLADWSGRTHLRDGLQVVWLSEWCDVSEWCEQAVEEHDMHSFDMNWIEGSVSGRE